MAWSGASVLVSSSDVRRTLKVIAEEYGLLVSCPCGASRWCPGRHAEEDSRTFWKLHAGHGDRKG